MFKANAFNILFALLLKPMTKINHRWVFISGAMHTIAFSIISKYWYGLCGLNLPFGKQGSVCAAFSITCFGGLLTSGVGVTNPIFSVPLFFPNDQHSGYLYDIKFIFGRCHRSWAAETPGKYQHDWNYLTYTFAKSKFPVTDKLANGALVTPIPGAKPSGATVLTQFTRNTTLCQYQETSENCAHLSDNIFIAFVKKL